VLVDHLRTLAVRRDTDDDVQARRPFLRRQSPSVQHRVESDDGFITRNSGGVDSLALILQASDHPADFADPGPGGCHRLLDGGELILYAAGKVDHQKSNPGGSAFRSRR
jgi:hypothetical protein